MSTIEAPAPTVTTTVTEADVLERAADLLEEFGWCQGRYGSKEYGSMCLAGAIDEANCDLLGRFTNSVDRRVISMTLGLYDGIGRSVIVWNDAPDRTKAEVVQRLRGAAASARIE